MSEIDDKRVRRLIGRKNAEIKRLQAENLRLRGLCREAIELAIVRGDRLGFGDTGLQQTLKELEKKK